MFLFILLGLLSGDSLMLFRSPHFMFHPTEKQTAALCGVHALNNLIQGPFFSAVGLGEECLGSRDVFYPLSTADFLC
jgi:hypothetical protein